MKEDEWGGKEVEGKRGVKGCKRKSVWGGEPGGINKTGSRKMGIEAESLSLENLLRERRPKDGTGGRGGG